MITLILYLEKNLKANISRYILLYQSHTRNPNDQLSQMLFSRQNILDLSDLNQRPHELGAST